MRRSAVALAVFGLGVASLPGIVAPTAAAASASTEYTVLYRSGTAAAAAHQAIRTAGGTVVRENTAIGLATVRSTNPRFAATAGRQSEIDGVARSRPIGYSPQLTRPKWTDIERLTAQERQAVTAAAAARATAPVPTTPAPAAEPLAGLQWDMAMIRATADGSYAVQRGDKRVLVGIMDTGIDATHPDIAPNFDSALSRNFTTDIPLIDGPCEPTDNACADPANVDENGHGTHVAGIVGAAINGLGIAGVAPNITLVNIRAGQDSGFFFLQPTVDALTYAGDTGIDVVNMSFFTDPWLYNCRSNPADTPDQQQEQRTIIAATQRALDYAHARGVTLVAALGNEHTDLGHPTVDATSPDFPPGTEKTRTVTNACLDMPTEGNHVIGVSSVGPSQDKADYSNYGVEQTDVSAPGGYYRDPKSPYGSRSVRNLVLSAYPASLAAANGDIDENGVPNNPFVIRDCNNGVCGYYQYLQGTSMAAPHAAGVAALIVSKLGHIDPVHGGLTFPPDATQALLQAMATWHACPTPRLMSYVDVGRPPSYDALCVGGLPFNGFYGHGIVDALSAATLRPRR